MKVMPSIEEVRELAKTGKYDVVPVSCEILSDFTTPIETIRILKNASTHAYMLESAWANERWGRYTFLGFDPKLEITCINGEITYGDKTEMTDDPSKIIREIMSRFKSPRFDYLPSFTGGLVGYFSYDYLTYAEPTAKCDVIDEENFKDVDLMLFDKVIAFDHVKQKLILITNMSLEDIDAGYKEAVADIMVPKKEGVEVRAENVDEKPSQERTETSKTEDVAKEESPEPKEESQTANPTMARTSGDPASGQDLERNSRTERKVISSTDPKDKPSVRKKLKECKEIADEQNAGKTLAKTVQKLASKHTPDPR